ncbi:unnamed protein product, partial [Symbiodinium pilosum]
MDMMESMIHPALGSEAHKYRRDMQISIPEDQDEHVYPPEAVQVRNTFIHVATPDHGLDDASKHVYSCPASHMGWITKLFEDEDDLPTGSNKPVICLE